MDIERLGHLVLKVSDLDASRQFYNGLLGLKISAESDEWRMIFFTLGDHHNFAVLEVGNNANCDLSGIGVDHFAFKLSGGMEALKQAKAELEAANVQVTPVDHHVSYSLYFQDPDGNRLEVYVDGVPGWDENPQLITTEATQLVV